MDNTTETATPATKTTAGTQHAIDYLLRYESSGARDYREMACMAVTLGRAATERYMTWRLAQILPAAQDINIAEVFGVVFSTITAPTEETTRTILRAITTDARASEIAAAIVSRAWTDAADQIAADRWAKVSPRAEAAIALRTWIAEESPLAHGSGLFAELLTQALARVDWIRIADHFTPDPTPSLDPLPDVEDPAEGDAPTGEEEQQPEEHH